MKRKGFALTVLSVALCTCATAAVAAPTSTAAMIAARQKFFGVENVDANTGAIKKDRVIFSWATNTTYVTSVLGHVILLDTYISRPELPTNPIDRRYTPFLPQDFVDVGPEAIFLGHGHGDHADNAAFIAKWTNIPIYSTPETCDVMQQDVARMAADPNAVNGGAKKATASQRRSATGIEIVMAIMPARRCFAKLSCVSDSASCIPTA